MQNTVKILIADSDTTSSMRLAKALLRLGCSVISAVDAIQVQNMARKENPSAMVLSSLLTGGGAAVMLKRIRSSAYTVGIPVIVLGKPGGSTREEAHAAGATEYIDSPEDSAAVCDSIQRHVAGWPVPLHAPAEVLSSPPRLAALQSAEVLDTSPSRLQDSITRIASLLLGVPVALLSIVDQDRQFFKSQIGLPDPWRTQRQTPLSHSFCQWAVSAEEELIVEDAREMSGLKGNLAIRDLGVIAYAGVPVHAPSGPVLGSFCAIDSKPRAWGSVELANLRNLARMAQSALAIEALTSNAAARSKAMLTMMLNAIQILRRGDTRLGSEVSTPLLELMEDQNRNLLQLTPDGAVPA